MNLAFPSSSIILITYPSWDVKSRFPAKLVSAMTANLALSMSFMTNKCQAEVDFLLGDKDRLVQRLGCVRVGVEELQEVRKCDS